MPRIVPPKQKRSREVFERVLTASDRLVRERPFSEVTVSDICNEAEVSMSSLYARFPTKDDILTTLFDRHVQVARDAASTLVIDAYADGADIEHVARLVMSAFIGFVREHGRLMTSIFETDALKEQYWQLSSEVMDLMVGLAAQAYDRDDPGLLRVLHVGARIASASIQRAVGVPMNFGERLGLTDDELVDELAAMLVAYWDRYAEVHPVAEQD